MDVIPDCPFQVGAVQRGEGGHAPESVVQEVPDIWIQTVN